MTVSFDLPPSIEQSLRSHFADFNQTAKEAALVELYRQEKLSHHELAESLGLSRLETDAVLKKHNVTEDLPTPGDIEGQMRDIQQLAA